ncbi:MAG: P1 family peptidase [Firmicutes bacterium]|nr:P1 family peptidase [Bacillota bacterium]
MPQIKLPSGIYVGHAEVGDKSGVTVILAPEGAVGGVDVRGCAPGTRETDLLRAEKTINVCHAVVFTGGSAFGLSALDGVMRYCREKNIGHQVGAVKIPLVAGAVIFDIGEGLSDVPDAQTGYCAALAAKSLQYDWGQAGAGTGATVGKILGSAHCQRGGIGAATVELGGAFVTAITVVNAMGDVIDHKTGKLLRGVHDGAGNLLGTDQLILSGRLADMLRGQGSGIREQGSGDVGRDCSPIAPQSVGADGNPPAPCETIANPESRTPNPDSPRKGGNTTLSCVITNVKLTKLEVNKLASIAHDGLAKSISPVHTDYDGDTVFALSKGDMPFDFTALSVMAVEAVAQSVISAVMQ